uniref:Uncharacterized protein n=1 Tax=viral metagenome TaxID=1070528 RepID=A0A6C0I453_9ZZZZ
MRNIRDSCIQFFQNEDIRKEIRDIISPIVDIVYNELYVYLWVICFYNVFLFFILLANLVLILHLIKQAKD